MASNHPYQDSRNDSYQEACYASWVYSGNPQDYTMNMYNVVEVIPKKEKDGVTPRVENDEYFDKESFFFG